MKKEDFWIANKWQFNVSMVALGVIIRFLIRIDEPLFDTIIIGAIWGVFVGMSFAMLIGGFLNWNKYKWNVVGWLVTAVCYVIYLVFFYESDIEMAVPRKIYLYVLFWSLGNLVIGFMFLGSFLSAKLK